MLSVRVPTSSSIFWLNIVFQRFNARCGCGQLRLQMSAFPRQRLNLSLNLPDLLLSILENEQLFQFRMHGRLTY